MTAPSTTRSLPVTMEAVVPTGQGELDKLDFHTDVHVPQPLLRCILNYEEMVTVKTATLHHGGDNTGILAPTVLGLGLDVDEAVLGDPVAVYS